MLSLNATTTTQQVQSEGSTDVSKAANGETGVAGKKLNSTKTWGAKGQGNLGGGEERVSPEKNKESVKKKEQDKERQQQQQQQRERELEPQPPTKASRRATSLLNLFMSNSQGRFF